MNNKQFIEQVIAIEQQLDSVVEHGSDDELFIASYLQGHLALIAKPMEIMPAPSIAILDNAVKDSLLQAFDNAELEVADQQKVYALWHKLLNDIVMLTP